MCVYYQYADGQYLCVIPVDALVDKFLRVCYNVPQVDEEFVQTCEILWYHAQLSLLDVVTNEAGTLTPSFIILEPDYLIDISSLTKRSRDYGHRPASYILARLQPIENARPLFLGNIADLFLDEQIHAEEEPDYRECMQKALHRYPIELAAYVNLRDKEKECQSSGNYKLHFEYIREVVNDTLHAPGHELGKRDTVLESSYICEASGLQG